MLALALIVVGLVALIYLLFFALRWKGWMLMAAGFVTALGVMWFWEDLPKAKSQKQRGQLDNQNGSVPSPGTSAGRGPGAAQ
ncbi:hypothetical protein GCM10010987_08510 [Bradyrhizobium guangdongense]|uniref:Uncharacterized protein n=1 Tax=Bradyrhizobium guangdongense TaxID=1325090 RepID=A0AA87W3I9_9BRAD|nr:hypothetical protein GCM10010987_08510 [Bradyrhizobium guangdongense]